jgi:hypothetical protein
LIFIDDREDIVLQTQAYGIRAARRKEGAIYRYQVPIRLYMKHRHRVRAGVYSEQHRATGIFNEILIGIERTEGKTGIVNPDAAGRSRTEKYWAGSEVKPVRRIAGGAVAL